MTTTSMSYANCPSSIDDDSKLVLIQPTPSDIEPRRPLQSLFKPNQACPPLFHQNQNQDTSVQELDDSACVQEISIVSQDRVISSTLKTDDTQRRSWVMNRFLWISYVQVLFSQLKQEAEGVVSVANYLSALDKILPLLPLIAFYEGAQRTISFQ